MISNPFPRRLLLISLLCFGLPLLRSDITLPAIISDHMVLQRDRECSLWGLADPGEQVTVRIAGEQRTTRANPEGKWSLLLPRLTEAGPFILTIEGLNKITINDVLAGEVWLGSGQSNMELRVSQSQNFEAEKLSANFPLLRMFKEESAIASTEQFKGKGRWVICTPATVGQFSATLYFFGREIHRTLGHPVGLINSSVGGTPIESWISPAAQEAAVELKPFFAEREIAMRNFDAEAEAKKYQQALATWKEQSAKAKTPEEIPRKPVDPVELHYRWNNVGGLFNGKIAPLIPFTIRGAVWYQGEANAGDKAWHYRYQLPLLINEWRRRWGDDFPFAWVQLPNIAITGREWPLIREGMLQTLRLPNTGMTVNIDIGDPKEIHPANKQEIGRRLSLWALAEVYRHSEIEWSGPLFAGYEKRGREIVISFTHAAGGLVARDGALCGFVIATADRLWLPAIARLEGDKVVVSHPDIADPIAVRYAWENNPPCSLFNTAGLPASPFRTDDWPIR
ncbi:MAG: sialate O-acetylesterase [Verrucomicrobiota bacterium]